jgi:hypothetical protein
MEQANGQKIQAFAEDANGKKIVARLRKQEFQKCSLVNSIGLGYS